MELLRGLSRKKTGGDKHNMMWSLESWTTR